MALGARLVCGGRRAAPDSAFFPPTVLTDIPRESPAYRDELFGPVGCVFVAHATSTTRSASRTTRASDWARARGRTTPPSRSGSRASSTPGSVFVNDMVVSDPRFPFGGVKASGYGRELSDVGLREFVNVKTVRIRIGERRWREEHTE